MSKARAKEKEDKMKKSYLKHFKQDEAEEKELQEQETKARIKADILYDQLREEGFKSSMQKRAIEEMEDNANSGRGY